LAIDDQLFSFKLDRYDVEWSVPTSSPEFSYRNLPPGSYFLMVKACDGFGFWGEPKVLLTVFVKPPFWETWWFLGTILFIIITAVVLVVKQVQRQRYMKRIA
jgi:hypothetical protein